MRYSSQGGITSKKASNKKEEEIHYRLRHLNTGRLVIDQEVVYNGITMRTLGLCPHLIINNLGKYSEKSMDTMQTEFGQLDQASSFGMEEMG
jgi:hypothetical protein